jgi:universal stress protein E
MSTFKKILVNINPIDDKHPALDQAMEVGARMQADVTIVDVLPTVPDRARPFVSDQMEQELVDHRWQLLHAIAATRGSAIGATLLRGPAPAISLIREIQIGGYDLLVRSHGLPHATPKPFGAVDMQLLRKCPCPVWLVGSSAHTRPRRILAAIDASSVEPGEPELNRSILDLALTIRDLEGSHLTVLHAWSAFGYQFLERRKSAGERDAFVDAARRKARHDLDAAVAQLGTKRAGVEPLLMEGEPQDVLPAYAESHGVDLVVMGTVARTGIAGFVMGNTAERILTRLRASVVAIKPRGFVSPVGTNAI